MSYKNKYLFRAENLYIRKGKRITDIGKLLGIPFQTVSKWKKKGNWDQKRKDFQRTSISIADRLKEALATLVSQLNTKKIDPKQADALSKMVKAIKVMDPDADIINVALVVMDDLLHFLKDKDKKAAEMIDQYIPAFGDYLWEKYGHK